VLLRLGQIYDELGVFLQDHSPEVLLSLGQRSLSGDESGVIDFHRRVDVVGVYVGISYIGISLNQPYSRVFERLQILVPVEV